VHFFTRAENFLTFVPVGVIRITSKDRRRQPDEFCDLAEVIWRRPRARSLDALRAAPRRDARL
jgi:hypothetical protein